MTEGEEEEAASCCIIDEEDAGAVWVHSMLLLGASSTGSNAAFAASSITAPIVLIFLGPKAYPTTIRSGLSMVPYYRSSRRRRKSASEGVSGAPKRKTSDHNMQKIVAG